MAYATSRDQQLTRSSSVTSQQSAPRQQRAVFKERFELRAMVAVPAARRNGSEREDSHPRLAARMRARMRGGEIFDIEVRVALGRVDAAVAEQFLYMPHISARAQQMRRERMTKGVRRNATADVCA